MSTLRHGLMGLAAVLLLAAGLRAQIPYSGGDYTQSFDSLPSSGSFTLSGNGPFPLDGAPVNASGLAGWSFGKHAGSGANATFFVSPGSSTSGGTYSYGATSTSERALGALGSGSVAARFGAVLRNDTGTTLTQFTLSYTGEQWRRGSATANRLTFAYAVGATDINIGSFVAEPTLDFVAPTTTGSGVALDGNNLANRVSVSATVNGLDWAPGEVLVIRWSDVDDSGSDDGLAIDDLTFSTPADQQPAVAATAPADGAVSAAPNASISIIFNMPVLVSGTWFSVTGSATGVHTPIVSGGPTTYTLTSATPFAEGETVTATVYAAQVVDAATGAMHPISDYTFSFTVLTTAPIPIHTVQGSGETSSYAGQVVTIEGVVTAAFQGASGLGGYYVQALESDYDADDETSEGMFVFDNTYLVAAGELVSVTGTVAEFGTAPSTQTELASVVYLEKLGTAALPAPVEVTLPFASVTEAERYEGMRVTLPQRLTVTDNYDLGRYGELILSVGRLPIPTNVVSPGLPAQAQDVANYLSQILVDDGVGPGYPDPTPYLADSAGRGLTRRAGSTVAGVTGILDEKFGAYVIEPTAPLAFSDDNPRGEPPPVGGLLRVMIGNVLNFFNGDGAGSGFPTARGADTLEEYQRQRDKIIAGIMRVAPDIMGLTEVENDGFGAASALADLVAGLNDAAPAGTTYALVDASAVDNGTDVIHNAFIYRLETVELVGAPAALSNQYFAGLARPPLAQTFREIASGEVLTVCVNHFRAKGSAASSAAATDGISPNPNLDTGDGQGTNNYLRLREAQTLVEWLATDPTGSGDPDVLIIGDLNAYAKEDPIMAILDAGYVNLTELFEGEGGYSYSFNGEFGHLDHALASEALAAQIVGAVTWHANSDEPAYLDYNTENKSAAQLALNTGTPYRYADHDPVTVGITLQPEPYAPTFTLQPESQSATVGDTVTLFVEVDAYPAPAYQWFRNDALLPGATGATLTLANITTADAGDYTAVATNSAGTATSAVATLTVAKAVATVTLSDLAHTHDGTPKAATVTTSPAGLAFAVTYDGATTPPSAPGSYAVVATVDDADYTGTATGTLVISDTTAPVITNLKASPATLAPANRKLVPVTLTATVTDAGDPAPVTKIISVTSNQPTTGKGDKTRIDWEITGLMTLKLRAECAPGTASRIYTITVESRDASGNTSTAQVTVSVRCDC